jgi:hypothetical protein
MNIYRFKNLLDLVLENYTFVSVIFLEVIPFKALILLKIVNNEDGVIVNEIKPPFMYQLVEGFFFLTLLISKEYYFLTTLVTFVSLPPYLVP